MQATGGKLTASHVEKLKEAPSNRITKRTKKELTVDEDCQIKKIKNVEAVTTLLENHEFCVLTGLGDSISKSDLETKIIQNGGSVVQHPG